MPSAAAPADDTTRSGRREVAVPEWCRACDFVSHKVDVLEYFMIYLIGSPAGSILKST